MPGTLEQRFWKYTDKRGPDECWPWTGAIHRGGGGGGEYGGICSGKRSHKVMAHRVAYEMLVGPIPEGLVIDHLCRNTLCVNPAHMEPVTNGENVRRGQGISTINREKTHCIAGHPFDQENTWRDKNGVRYCRACMRRRGRETAARKRAKA